MFPRMGRMAEEEPTAGEGIWVSGGGSPFTLFPSVWVYFSPRDQRKV